MTTPLPSSPTYISNVRNIIEKKIQLAIGELDTVVVAHMSQNEVSALP